MSRLFNRITIFDVIAGAQRDLRKAIQEMEADYLLNASEDDLAEALVEEFKFEIPTLDEDNIHIADSREVDIDVSRDTNRLILDRSRPFYLKGTQVTVAIPFHGDAGFFEVMPQSFTHPADTQDTTLKQDEVLLTYRSLNNDSSIIKQGYESFVRIVRLNLASLRVSADQHNSQLAGQARQLIRERKNKLLADARMLESIGLPIKRRQGVPATYTVPVQKRAPKIERPSVPKEKFQPEPALAMEEYENILSIIGNMVRVMEQSPKAFEQMGEENLRTHFLVQLNGQYEGRATGETFNFQGKTDILIKEEGRNVFVAECKIWRGQKEFLEALDQLLSYLSWRDTKAALLLFNRNANFSDVLEKIAVAAPTHKCFKRELSRRDSEFRYIFCQPNDSNREVVLTVLAFDIPTAERQSN